MVPTMVFKAFDNNSCMNFICLDAFCVFLEDGFIET
jgi:hypothetical protein